MNFFRKIFVFVFIITLMSLILIVSSCTTDVDVIKNVSLVKKDIFCGNYGDVTITAELFYGETNENLDGIIGEKETRLRFLFPLDEQDKQYSLLLNYNGLNYIENFIFNEEYCTLIAEITPEGFNKKQFDAYILISSTKEKVSFSSILPQYICDYKSAIKSLYNEKQSLFDSYIYGNKINAEIMLKINYLNEKTYWYVQILFDKTAKKVFLLDAVTLELLATKDL